MKYSKSGADLTKSFESCRLTAYKDGGGVWTIGWGHTKNVHAGDTCTQEQADIWLFIDIKWAEDEVNEHVKVALSQKEFDALVDFVFNIGGTAFANSTLLKMLNSGNISGAAHEFERWDMDNGVHVAGLLRRRLAEETEFKEGMA